MKFLPLLTLLLPISVAYSDQVTPIFKGEVPLEAGSFRGKATLTLSKTKIKAGEKFAADIRFLNKSGGANFYNPFFNGLRPLPVKLAIFDSKKKYIGDLLASSGGSRVIGEIGKMDSDLTYIASLAYVGKESQFTAGLVQGTEYEQGIPVNGKQRYLPVGCYYLQVIYNTSFISRDYNYYNSDLFRSNVAELQIIN